MGVPQFRACHQPLLVHRPQLPRERRPRAPRALRPQGYHLLMATAVLQVWKTARLRIATKNAMSKERQMRQAGVHRAKQIVKTAEALLGVLKSKKTKAVA